MKSSILSRLHWSLGCTGIWCLWYCSRSDGSRSRLGAYWVVHFCDDSERVVVTTFLRKAWDPPFREPSLLLQSPQCVPFMSWWPGKHSKEYCTRQKSPTKSQKYRSTLCSNYKMAIWGVREWVGHHWETSKTTVILLTETATSGIACPFSCGKHTRSSDMNEHTRDCSMKRMSHVRNCGYYNTFTISFRKALPVTICPQSPLIEPSVLLHYSMFTTIPVQPSTNTPFLEFTIDDFSVVIFVERANVEWLSPSIYIKMPQQRLQVPSQCAPQWLPLQANDLTFQSMLNLWEESMTIA